MIDKLILIGASTGGPGHLKKILSQLGDDFTTPVIIAQHMNRVFISTFVLQFNNELDNRVLEIRENMTLENGKIYICSNNTVLEKRGFNICVTQSDIKSLYNPSVNLLFNSAVKFASEIKIMAILLTGIGDDGAEGLSNLQKNGAKCIAENEESAIVYGMPKRAIELNPNIKSENLVNIIGEIIEFNSKN